MLNHQKDEQDDKNRSHDHGHDTGGWKRAVTESFEYECSIHPLRKGKVIVE